MMMERCSRISTFAKLGNWVRYRYISLFFFCFPSNSFFLFFSFVSFLFFNNLLLDLLLRPRLLFFVVVCIYVRVCVCVASHPTIDQSIYRFPLISMMYLTHLPWARPSNQKDRNGTYALPLHPSLPPPHPSPLTRPTTKEEKIRKKKEG
ncbi:hypothetical protein DFH27DRAFT_94844 [Peziza echinospora]|nr:hypothetical protein DFH27DRAFT_94844 [Peziza echinospora]